MSFNGSGTFLINSSGQPVVTGTAISSTVFNALTADLATGLTTVITKDGQTTPTANIPMGAFKITGLGAATARTDAASLATIQDGTGVYVATVGGTADAITLTPSPAITAYAAGQSFRFIAGSANTGAATVAISGLAAKAITKNGTTALAAGDIPSGSIATINYDGTRFILAAVLDIPVSIVDAKGDIIAGTAADAVARLAVGANQTLLEADSTQTTGLIWVNRPDFGQAQLTYTDTTHVKLLPFNGNKLVVNGVVCTVPDAGVSYTISGLSSSTLYYVYAVATTGAISSIELSTTVPVASTTAGNKGTMIKTGDDTRSLVGMVRTDGSTLFANTDLKRFVRSWFNDPGIGGYSVLGSDVALSVSGGPWAKVSNNAKIEFLAWADEVGHADISASWLDSTGGVGQLFYVGIGLNSEVTPGSTPYAAINYDTVGYYKNSCTSRSDKLTVGYNYYVMIYIIGGGATPFLSSAAGISYLVGK